MNNDNPAENVFSEENDLEQQSKTDYHRFISKVKQSTEKLDKTGKGPGLKIEDYRHLFSTTTAYIACFQYPNGIPLQSTHQEIVDQLWSSNSRCLEVSLPLAKLTGFETREAALGVNFGKLFPPNEFNFNIAKAWVEQGLSAQEIVLQAPDKISKHGSLFTSIYSRTKHGKIFNIWIISRQRTKKLPTQSNEEQAEQHYRTLVERPGVILIRRNLKRAINYISSHITESLGVSPQELQQDQQLFEHLIHPSDIAKYQRIAERRESGCLGVIESEFRLRHKDNSYRWYYKRETVRLDSNSNPYGYDSIIIDIQERKRFEASLLRAQRIETLGTMAGGIAHDFNNHLAAILGQLNLSLSEVEPETPTHKRLVAAEQAALACAGMTKHLLSFARNTESDREPLCPRLFLKECRSLLERVLPSKIKIELSIPTSLPPIFGNHAELKQVIMNLAINARDAMPEGGILNILASIFLVDKSKNNLNTYPTLAPGEYIEIKLIDSGKGVPQEHLPLIFDPYFTTKHRNQGSGLGLSTAYSIVTRHKGDIRAESTPMQGSTFSFVIPVSQVPALEPTVDQSTIPKTGSECILVADDDELVLQMICSALEIAGYEVISASDGNQALKVFRENHSSIKLALIDHGMPEKSGREVLDEINKLNQTLPCILTSGFEKEDLNLSLASEKVDFVKKPYNLNQLLQMIRSLLDREI